MQQPRSTELTTITVQARFFALYRERVGQSVLSVVLPARSTVGDLVGEIMLRYPALSPNPSAIVVAVDREYASHDRILGDGNEAAFIPPVSGGAPC